MALPLDLSRRKALKILAAAPMLPLGGMATASLLTACGGSDSNAASPASTAAFSSAAFGGMAAPTLADPNAMAKTSVASTMIAKFADGSSRTYKLAYQPFFMTGDTVPNTAGGTIVAGGYFDIDNQPIIDRSTAGKERQFFSDCPDGTSLLKLDNPTVKGVKGNAVFAVVQFEYTTRDQAAASMYGRLPSPIAVLTLDQDPATGKLSLVSYANVDTSAAHGLWITCGASLSPWNTHLSSEEYEPDAALISTDAQFKAYSKNLYGDETRARAYHYGHIPEVTVHPDGTGTIKKHYCLGRISHELIQVMPDKRTVMMGDDATNGGVFMFVADKEADLSAGTLYVAKCKQTSSAGAGASTLTWLNLGHATSDEIENLANTLTITDIMDVVVDEKVGPTLDASYTRIHFNGKFNWIRIKPGMEKAAAFLETHRYAALRGASMSFTKLEGTTVNAKDKIVYSAMSQIVKSMVKGNEHSTDIAVDKAITSGAVYAFNLKGGQRDVTGAAINSEWVPVDMAAPDALVGEDIASDSLGNLSNPERIANPDNLKFSEKLRTLFIGEDSGGHVNNFLWAYNVDTKTLTRILSAPAGAESTGLHAVDEINGWTYIMSNFQHAGDWETALHAKVQPTLDPLIRANYKDRFGAAVGYLTADPTSIKLG
ncbi:alkaline phosphatase [Caballeronia hypogeia]|uniref:Alkaline phosphatase n=1 Tax=Caballeronia hypogeia TaxID=1777140 RepID=A0A158A3L3_9BURK|nr:alkaline phosphatase PhoX [Caballeronia hypogeia]SAK52388.1 alkaline phosphatase [Caballeronia hypogeia]